MKRRNFLRDIALGIAATLVPKILMPMDVQECLFDESRLNEALNKVEYGAVIKFPMRERMLEIRSYAHKNQKPS